MARLEALPEIQRKYLEKLPCPTFDQIPWIAGTPLNQRRLAIVSTAGLHRKQDRPFTLAPGDDYRVIPGNIKANELVMNHVFTECRHSRPLVNN
jgi:D-proline reductase (dithiol) PrdB